MTALPPITRLALAAGLALLVGCGAHATKDSASRLGQAVRPEMRIAQLDYGRKAHYAVCAEPACPVVTPKSLAAAASGVPTSVSRSAVSSAPSVVSEISRKVSAALPQETRSPIRPEKSLDVSAETPAPHRGSVIVHFKWNSQELTPEAIETLDQAMDTARRAARIDIAGRTDNSGSAAANAAMALHRALAVRDYLTQHLPASHGEIVIDAKGDCCFIASNDTWAGRHENRRVEIVFTPSAESDHDTR